MKIPRVFNFCYQKIRSYYLKKEKENLRCKMSKELSNSYDIKINRDYYSSKGKYLKVLELVDIIRDKFRLIYYEDLSVIGDLKSALELLTTAKTIIVNHKKIVNFTKVPSDYEDKIIESLEDINLIFNSIVKPIIEKRNSRLEIEMEVKKSEIDSFNKVLKQLVEIRCTGQIN